jgi:uncharacterized protein YggU (UPF0235/DUF167 family)
VRYISVKAHAGVRKRELKTTGKDRYEVFTKMPKIENRANDDIRRQLAEFLSVPIKNIMLVRGQNQANKVFVIHDGSKSKK